MWLYIHTSGYNLTWCNINSLFYIFWNKSTLRSAADVIISLSFQPGPGPVGFKSIQLVDLLVCEELSREHVLVGGVRHTVWYWMDNVSKRQHFGENWEVRTRVMAKVTIRLVYWSQCLLTTPDVKDKQKTTVFLEFRQYIRRKLTYIVLCTKQIQIIARFEIK